ncbi:outer membrane lipoprotein-sorting protein [Congregibacter litoralis]|uniref:Uncharacterized protein TP-0789 domain-containing protein n=1 Tax=Congregibacter litoralis KT71 TaxID=314285 RepID=A4A575_9GAMM|nr:outer membrane lipoprotein-sorting protein [Congregibacter litoralis]EAQ98946.2 hypothetical protein KT71_09972 [Congregibacter litoralis KT71]
MTQNHRSAAKARRLALSLLLAVGTCCAVSGSIGADPGYSLANAIFTRDAGADLAMVGKMTLRTAKGKERTREFVIYQRDTPSGLAATLIRFNSPASIRNTALLDDPREDGLWLYLPALDRVRRISSSNRGGRFVNTQLYYEDLRARHPGDDIHELVGDREYEGVSTQLLQSIPRDKSKSVYSKRLTWVHPELLLPLRVDLYEGSEQASKRLLVKRIDEIQGVWTITRSVMENLATGESTVMTFTAVRYDQGLPHDLFTTSSLKNPTLESSYRP